MAAYHYLLRHLPLRPVLLWGTVLCAACQASSLVLATRANLALGLDDHLFALGDSVLVGVAGCSVGRYKRIFQSKVKRTRP